jgi:hypothetical protein
LADFKAVIQVLMANLIFLSGVMSMILVVASEEKLDAPRDAPRSL